MIKGFKTLAGIRKRRFAIACGALLVLAFLQVSIASHQFEHVAEDAYKYCRVCAQHDRLDDDILDSDTSQVQLLPAKGAASEAAPVLAFSGDNATPYHSRAPPVS
tara:strand:- start:11306 stop:11620 length:315 start_codon:yes stop_codon:yes gene_type:complete